MAFLQGGEFLFVEKPAWTKDFYKSQQRLSIPAWGRAKFPLALLLQLRPARNQPGLPSSGPLRKTLEGGRPGPGAVGSGEHKKGRFGSPSGLGHELAL